MNAHKGKLLERIFVFGALNYSFIWNNSKKWMKIFLSKSKWTPTMKNDRIFAFGASNYSFIWNNEKKGWRFFYSKLNKRPQRGTIGFSFIWYNLKNGWRIFFIPTQINDLRSWDEKKVIEVVEDYADFSRLKVKVDERVSLTKKLHTEKWQEVSFSSQFLFT